MRKLMLVIFDLDGVLTETSYQHYLAWKELAQSIDIDLDIELNERLKGVSRDDSINLILHHGNKIDLYNDKQKKELSEIKNTNYVERIKHFTEGNLFDGVQQLLNELKMNDIKIALGSASRNAPDLLKSMKIYDFFDYIVDPQTVKGKPSPDTYLKAAQHFGIPVENCIGVEDAVSGVEAIKSAHMFAIGIGDKKILNKANFIVNSISDLSYIRIIEVFKGSNSSNQ